MDKGELIENYAYIRLRDLYGLDSLYYWRTADGNEVDFLVEEGLNKGKSYEVKFSDAQFKVNKYKKFIEGYPQYNLRNLVFEKTGEKAIDIFKF